MDIYNKKSRWKIGLAIGGIIVIGASLFFTNYLAKQLKESERVKVELWAATVEDLSAGSDLTENLNVTTRVLELINDIPVIIVNEEGKVEEGMNFGENRDNNLVFLERELAKIKRNGVEPIIGAGGYAAEIYYRQTRLITLLTYFPLIQVFLIFVIMGLGYIGFSAARRAEQNRVWVGMAKETAHQLGTPISAMLAWIEHLKLTIKGDEEQLEIVKELRHDIKRLELVADRFSKIGSAPVLEPVSAFKELAKCRDYMMARAPRKVVFSLPEPAKDFQIQINPHLFDWVIENLMRNSLDAMDGKGEIGIILHEDSNHVNIDVSDTGKGIHSSKVRTVFEPGYSTKSRGWGLGLSLAKRIIENYHKGKIFVARSEVNKGTTFTIKMPKVVSA